MILKFLKIFKQKKLFFAVVLTVVAAGLFFPGGNAHASLLESVGGFVMDIIAPIIYLVFYIFFYIAYIVAWIGASVINMTLNPAIINSVLNINDTAMPLFKAWAIFRDIANLFFILVLLFIAIGTIVRSQSYNLKNLLPKLIIAVFLINFSNVIAGAIIDFGNIFMYGVLKWMCVSGTNKCFQDFYAQMMEVIDILFWKYPITAISFDFKDAASIGIAAIYTFIYGLVLMALGIFLVIRIAVLALLIILSPLAFVGEVFPGLKEISSEWWDKLIKYVMFGPIFALLLYVSGLMAQNTIAVDPKIFETNPNLSWMAQNITLILTNIIPLIFLLAIIPITQKLGVAGANAVLGSTVLAGGGFLAGATKFAGGAIDRYLARGAQSGYGKKRRALSYFSPGAWKRAIKAHTAESEHDYDRAAGKMREKFVQPATDWGRKSAVKHEEDARQREVARQRADIKGKDKGEIVYLMTEAFDRGMLERAEAIALELGTTSDTNEVYTKIKGNNGEFYENTPDGFVKFMKEKFEPKLGEDKTGRLMAELANLEKKDGHHAFKGSSSFDMASGKYVIEKNRAIREAKAAEEFGKIEPQAKWRGLDKRTLIDERTNPATGLKEWVLADRGASIIENITKADLENVRKGKPEHLKIIRKALEPAGIASLTPAQRTAIGVGVAGSKFEEFKKKLDEAINVGIAGSGTTGGPGSPGGGGGYAGGGAYTAGGGYIYTAPLGGGGGGAGGRGMGTGGGGGGGRGPRPASGGADPGEVMRGTFGDIRKRAEDIQSGKMSSSEKEAAFEKLHSEFVKAMNMDAKDFGQDIGKELGNVKKEEEKKTLEAIRNADKSFKGEIEKSGDRMSRETYFKKRADQIHNFARETNNDDYQTPEKKLESLKIHHDDYSVLVKGSGLEKDPYMKNVEKYIVDAIKETKKQINKK